MKKLMILKTGSTFPSVRDVHGDFEEHILRQAGLAASDVITLPAFENPVLPSPEDLSGIIITGSHAMVSDREDWSCRLAHWLRHVCGDAVPVLGICYGHQLLAEAWGGRVDYHPGGREVGTVDLELTEAGRGDALLGCLPERFSAHVFHAQSVRSLPPEARILARNAFEPHHAFVVRDRLWGVQFHPEFTEEITSAYVSEEAEALAAEGMDVEGLKARITGHPWGKALLERFLTLI